MDGSSKSVPRRTISVCLNDISKNIEQLHQKLKEKKRSFVECSDLYVFKELCTHEDGKIRGIACKTITDLAKSNLFPLTQALSWYTAILQSDLGSNHDGIIRAVTDLFLISDENVATCCSSQHPFVVALKKNEENWPIIEFQIDYIFKHEKTSHFQRAFALLIPVFRYTLWSTGNVSSLCRRAAWKCLIRNLHSENFDFLVETISWFRNKDRKSILDVYYFLSHYEDELHEITKQKNASDSLCVYYAYTSCKMAEYGYDPAIILETTRKLLKKYPTTVNIVLALFAQTLTRCPVEFVNTFLLTCVELIEFNDRTFAATEWLIISAILPWLLLPSDFTEQVHITAATLFDIVYQKEKCTRGECENSSSSLISNEYFIRIVTSEEDVYWAFVIARSLENSNYVEFLRRIRQIQIQVEEITRYPLLHLGISAIFLSVHDFNIQNAALTILIGVNAEFYLSHILFLLAKAPSPEMQLKLLYSLPYTAVEKENVSSVLRSIDSFFSSDKRILTHLSMKLYLALWKTEERCYSFLHDRLLEYETLPSENVLQRDVILTSVIRDICVSKPDKHGQEWISILNEVIKRWHKKQNGSLPSALALDAITCLCRAEVLGVISIYELLSERLFDDNRVEVMIKFHALIECMFETTRKAAFDRFKDILLHAVSKMWTVVSSSAPNEVVFSAISALSKFDKNEIPLKIIPALYKEHVKLPMEYLNKSGKEISELKENLPYVPGNVWINLLQKTRPQVKPRVCDMLMTWLREEVENFPRGLYGSIRGEPTHLKILHDKCVFKAFIEYLKTISKRNDLLSEQDLETSIMCLKLLNGDLPKTLPLFNWTFLLPLLHVQQPALSEQVIILFAKQSVTSSSARISVEDYLGNFHDMNKVEELKVVFNVITDLCRGISSVVLKNFLTLVECCATMNSDNCGDTFPTFIWDRLAEALRSQDIDENNRVCVSECIKNFWFKTSYENEAFGNLLNSAIELPSTYIDHLCSYDGNQRCSDQLRKIIKLQCTMAVKSSRENPFHWLQKSIEIAAFYPELQDFYFEYSLPVIKKYRSHSNSWPWLLQYSSYIHSSMDKLSEFGVNFFYNALIFIVVNLSVYEPFVSNRFNCEEYFLFFPQALKSIVFNKTSSQIIVDWLNITIKSMKINLEHKALFYNTIVSLKNEKYLLKM